MQKMINGLIEKLKEKNTSMGEKEKQYEELLDKLRDAQHE